VLIVKFLAFSQFAVADNCTGEPHQNFFFPYATRATKSNSRSYLTTTQPLQPTNNYMIVHERHGVSHRSGVRCDLCDCTPGFASDDNIFIRLGGNSD
jgi:hypothetical protein